MPSSLVCGAVVLAGAGIAAQTAGVDPEQLLSTRLAFTAAEVGQVRQGQPVVRVKLDADELSAVGAIRLPGRKERLADWVKNIDHFRRSAEIGMAQPIPTPPSAASLAGVTLDAADRQALQACTAEKCAMRVSADLLARIQHEPSRADEVFRGMLLAELTGYIAHGNAAAVAPLVQKATTLTALSPELARFLERYPSATLPSADQMFYWGWTPAGSVAILTLHHLILYKPRPGEIWIADKNLYASRYFDTGVLVIGLYDAADGNGFYAVAGSRATSGYLSGTAASLLRRRIQRSASDTVKVYLEWLRDSLSAG
ncbi:MAG TPA: hypothetical protein VGI12_14325 [Vicinamibacterales bacterium]|jgi:hypothetical protein